MNSINNNINFKAKLNISELKVNKERWQKIAKEFQNKTKQYPLDEFSLVNNDINSEQKVMWFGRTKKNDKAIDCVHWGSISDSLFKRMELLSDSEIVSMLKRLFNIQRNAEDMEKEIWEYGEKYGLLDKSLKSGSTLFENLFSVMSDSRNALIERHLKNDKFLYKNSKEINFYY